MCILFLNVHIHTIQQIPDFLHVNFHIRHLDSEFQVAWCSHDTIKDLTNNTRNDTSCVFIVNVSTLMHFVSLTGKHNPIGHAYHHSKCFTRTSLTIGEYSTVITSSDICWCCNG